MKNLATLFFLLLSAQLFSQIPLAGFEYSNFPQSAIVDGDNGQEISFEEIGGFINIPIKLKNEKTTLINTFKYDLVRATAYNSPLFNESKVEKNLHQLSYGFTVVHRWSPKWAFILRLRPTLASDFEDSVSNDDFLVLGAALVSKKVNDKFSFGGGLAYTTQTGEPLVLPVITLKHNTKKHSLDIQLPTHIKYTHSVGPLGKIKIGAKAETQGRNYHITLKEFALADPATIEKIIYTRLNLGPTASFQLGKSIQFEASGGYSVMRKYQFEDVDDNKYEYDSDNGPFFNFSVKFVPQPKSAN